MDSVLSEFLAHTKPDKQESEGQKSKTPERTVYSSFEEDSYKRTLEAANKLLDMDGLDENSDESLNLAVDEFNRNTTKVQDDSLKSVSLVESDSFNRNSREVRTDVAITSSFSSLDEVVTRTSKNEDFNTRYKIEESDDNSLESFNHFDNLGAQIADTISFEDSIQTQQESAAPETSELFEYGITESSETTHIEQEDESKTLVIPAVESSEESIILSEDNRVLYETAIFEDMMRSNISSDEVIELDIVIDYNTIKNNLEEIFRSTGLPTIPFELAGIAKFVESIEGYTIVDFKDHKIAISNDSTIKSPMVKQIDLQIQKDLARGLISDVSVVGEYMKNGMTYQYLVITLNEVMKLASKFKRYGCKFIKVVENGETVDYRLRVGV